MKTLFLVILIIFLLAGIPVGYGIGISAVIGMIATKGIQYMNVAQSTINGINNFTLLAIPLFLLAGKLMNTGGVTTRLFRFAKMCVGWLPGGLGHVNVLCSLIFAGMSGSAVADAGGLGSIEMKAQRDAGYDDDFSVGVTAATSCLGPLIPPSIPLILFGTMSGASVGSLFLAGIFPGIILALALMLMVSFFAHKKGYPREAFPGIKAAAWAFVDAILPLFAVIIILAGRFSGIFTTTEAAAVVVIYALILSTVVYREVNLKGLHQILVDTVKDSATIGLILAFSQLFGTVLIKSMFPQQLAAALGGVITSKTVMIIVIVVFLLVVGMFMESTAAMTILVPILLPMAVQYGMSPIQLGVVVVLAMGVGALSPPFGILIFVMSRVADMDSVKIIKAYLPWICLIIAVTFLTAFVPIITTWLPAVSGLSLD